METSTRWRRTPGLRPGPAGTASIPHLPFVVADGGVHLLLVDVLDLGGGAAQDALLLLLGQRLGDHLDGLGPLVPAGHRDGFTDLRGLLIAITRMIQLRWRLTAGSTAQKIKVISTEVH